MNKEVSVQSYANFTSFLTRECGIVLGDAKQYLVRSRLLPIMNEYAFASVDETIQAVVSKRNLALTKAAIEAMTTNETLWFRDKYPFEILSNILLPTLAKTHNRLSIWSAACSSGQEPYSIAISLLEFKKAYPRAFPGGVSIVGTDLSLKVIEHAKLAVYEELAIKRGLPDDFKNRYFEQQQNSHYKLKDEVKRLVTFKQLNLVTQKNKYEKADIVFCRNVLIYFDNAEKTAILQNISASLQKGGTLLLGASESLAGAQSDYEMIKSPSGLYYSRR